MKINTTLEKLISYADANDIPFTLTIDGYVKIIIMGHSIMYKNDKMSIDDKETNQDLDLRGILDELSR